MHHEHHGNCCQQPAALAPEQHKHHHMVVPLGHVCTGACLHEVAEMQALTTLEAQRATIQQLQTGTFETAETEMQKAKKDKKSKKKHLHVGAFSLASGAAA